MDTAKDAISKIDGNDVVEKAGEVTDKINDVTGKDQSEQSTGSIRAMN